MTKRTIIIQYDPMTADDGGPIDLLSYLENEFDNRHIEATLFKAGDPSALERLISTVEATGGLIAYENGTHAPNADPDWIDLGDAYLAACEELGREPLIPNDERNEPGGD